MFKGIHHLGISQTITEGFLRLYSDPTDSVPLEYNHVLIMYFFFLGHHRLLRGRVYPGMCVCSGEGNGTPLQYSCLENPMDGGAWWAAVQGVAKSQTRLHFHFHFSLSCIGEGNGNPLQCSCLENPRDGEAWWAVVYGVTQSRTRVKRLSSSSSMGGVKPSLLWVPLYKVQVLSLLFP